MGKAEDRQGASHTGQVRVGSSIRVYPSGTRRRLPESSLSTASSAILPLALKASNSFFSQRSGDIFLILEPYAVPVEADVGSTHGSPWNYDAQVPLILWGEPFRPGYCTSPCQPSDLAPTIAVALGLSQPSSSQGRPLTQALR